jgi:F0F1-type ATP synthase membrane subunit b/b'
MATDSSVAVKDQQQTAQLTASYRYNTIQRLALENEKTANRFRIILAISIVFFIVLVILISYFINRYKNKQRELREEQIKKHLQEVNSLKLEFADATESYKENLHELQLLEESRKKVISIIRDELHGLNKEKDNYKKKYTELKLLKDRISEEYEKSIEVFRKENCELNEKIETLKQQDGISEHIKGSNQFVKNEIVKQIKDMTDNPLSTISPKQWENLIEVFSEFYPVLYKDIL